MSYVDDVDRIMAAPKTIVGRPAWAPSAYDGQVRWLAPLAVAGAVSPMDLVVDAYPRSDGLKFCILLKVSSAVMRIDYREFEKHRNHPVKNVALPTEVIIGWVHGPHVHLWSHNRVLVRFQPPKTLEFAISLPANVRGFDNTFRWFCSEANIVLGPFEIPQLPTRDLLL
ncbi:MAG: hypothetical protein EON54_11850 [Alcaligenaceae bacterium]|nr:MAG: hypothetical protein EON54_11850 [Alcaligenaceae bacterium]